jgi:ribosomal protein S18 acetylase RimI-like enzyme
MGSVPPSDDRGWFELVLGNQAPLWRLIAEACGGHVVAGEGVHAAVVPACPERSFFNSVFYEDRERMIDSLPRLAEAYEGAGVNAWTVWIPADDTAAAAALEEAGHKLDAKPRAMGVAISELRMPEPDPELEIRQETDMEKIGSINEVAYGYPMGQFPEMAPLPGTLGYLADLDGETVGATLAWDHGDDCEITFVATLPEARGRGVARRLMAQALVDAGERGRLATTLISTRLGYPVYSALGYGDAGGLQMWERRK